MDIIFVILPFALAFAIVGIIGYIWAVRSGQFDDLETPAMRMMVDDEEAKNVNPKK